MQFQPLLSVHVPTRAAGAGPSSKRQGEHGRTHLTGIATKGLSAVTAVPHSPEVGRASAAAQGLPSKQGLSKQQLFSQVCTGARDRGSLKSHIKF